MEVKVTLYGQTTVYASKAEAIDTLMSFIMGSEGSEQARYIEALTQIHEGLTEVSGDND